MSLKNTLIVLWVYIMYVLGLWIFLSGYLLKRIVVHQNSTSVINIGTDINCQNISSLSSLNVLSEDVLRKFSAPLFQRNDRNYLNRFQKAIIIIIDALRYDFVTNFSSAETDEHYMNKMPVFSRLVDKYPFNAVLLRLVADPPTTTLQRLQGLTTGSLPTFIDVSLNFASSEIAEDNFIWQMKSVKKPIVFMGDDTWESLFPNQFHRSYPYPSFNVKDLDTVDNGILDHIYEEIEKNDSQIVIAHFLGVDHCGHRYGPKHPEMRRKLLQMNDVIEKITGKLENDTLLVVLGDHGMTESGDHGGDSYQEVSTVLFMYSANKLLFNLSIHDSSPSQVDVVPTLSLLLGIPIPFSNLGCVIPHLFTLNVQDVCFHDELDPLLGSALAIAENSLQVQRYLHAYSNISNEISFSLVKAAEEKLKRILLLWNNVTNNINESKNILLEICEGYRNYLQFVRHLCEKKWAAFNMDFIVAGTTILCIAILWNFFAAEQLSHNYFVFTFCTIVLVLLSVSLYVFSSLSICLLTGLTILYLAVKYKRMLTEDLIQYSFKVINIPAAVSVLMFFISFSNSFIIEEDHVIMYLLQSIILCRFHPCLIELFKLVYQSNKNKAIKRNQKASLKCILQPFILMCLLVCIKLGTAFYKCREEQISCVNSNFIISLEKLHGMQTYKLLRLFISLSSVIIPVIIFLNIINFSKATKSQTVTEVCIKYGIFFVCVCTSLRWWLNIVSPEAVDRILKGSEVLLTRTASFICIIMCIIISLFPILPEKPWEVPSKEIYCGSLGSLFFIILQLLSLIAGDALAPAVMLMSLSIIFYIILNDLSSESHIWTDVVTWSLLSRHWFYSTAHQAAFTSIQWDAAFLFNHKEIYSYVLSGALVILNTFSSNILHGLALPLLLVWSEPSSCTSHSLLRLHMKYLICFGIKLMGTVLASIILRRHLMVWKIFSPKLLYEILGMIITMISVTASHCFMAKVTFQYHNLIRMNLNSVFSSKDK